MTQRSCHKTPQPVTQNKKGRVYYTAFYENEILSLILHDFAINGQNYGFGNIGKFYGYSSDNTRINGTAPAIDLAATYQIAESLSVQGRYAFIGSCTFYDSWFI